MHKPQVNERNLSLAQEEYVSGLPCAQLSSALVSARLRTCVYKPSAGKASSVHSLHSPYFGKSALVASY